MARARTRTTTQPRPRLRDRSTGDLLVLMVAGTVCTVVLGSGAVLLVAKIVNPEIDVSDASRQIADVINTLIGLMAGFLAGRTDYTIQQQRKAQEQEPPS